MINLQKKNCCRKRIWSDNKCSIWWKLFLSRHGNADREVRHIASEWYWPVYWIWGELSVVQIKELKLLIHWFMNQYQNSSKPRSESTRSHENVPFFQKFSTGRGNPIPDPPRTPFSRNLQRLVGSLSIRSHLFCHIESSRKFQISGKWDIGSFFCCFFYLTFCGVYYWNTVSKKSLKIPTG